MTITSIGPVRGSSLSPNCSLQGFEKRRSRGVRFEAARSLAYTDQACALVGRSGTSGRVDSSRGPRPASSKPRQDDGPDTDGPSNVLREYTDGGQRAGDDQAKQEASGESDQSGQEG